MEEEMTSKCFDQVNRVLVFLLLNILVLCSMALISDNLVVSAPLEASSRLNLGMIWATVSQPFPQTQLFCFRIRTTRWSGVTLTRAHCIAYIWRLKYKCPL
jgi:hypothetical protein